MYDANVIYFLVNLSFENIVIEKSINSTSSTIKEILKMVTKELVEAVGALKLNCMLKSQLQDLSQHETRRSCRRLPSHWRVMLSILAMACMPSLTPPRIGNIMLRTFS
jgi:hypothetical protein